MAILMKGCVGVPDFLRNILGVVLVTCVVAACASNDFVNNSSNQLLLQDEERKPEQRQKRPIKSTLVDEKTGLSVAATPVVAPENRQDARQAPTTTPDGFPNVNVNTASPDRRLMTREELDRTFGQLEQTSQNQQDSIRTPASIEQQLRDLARKQAEEAEKRRLELEE